MTSIANAPPPSFDDIPIEFRSEARSRLRVGEQPLAALTFDLDPKLHFVAGLVLITEQRLLSCEPDGSWREWAYQAGLALRLHDHAGVGHLELVNDQSRLAVWRFTLAHNLHAIRLVDQFQIHLASHISGEPPLLPEGHRCPSCK